MATSLPTTPQVLHEDRSALVDWAGAAATVLACSGASLALLHFGWEGVPLWPGADLGEFPPWMLPFLLTIAWMGAGGYVSWALTRARLRVVLGSDGGLVVTRRYPFREKAVSVPAGATTPAWLVECTNDEGDLSFRAEVPRPDGGHVVLAEFASRADCEALCRRYNAALGLEGRGWARGGDR